MKTLGFLVVTLLEPLDDFYLVVWGLLRICLDLWVFSVISFGGANYFYFRGAMLFAAKGRSKQFGGCCCFLMKESDLQTRAMPCL